jgi:hypothetical protein
MKNFYLALIAMCFTFCCQAIDSISVSKGVVVDQRTDTFYVMTSDKSLLAQKRTGQELWQLPVNAMPLFVEGEYLISMKDGTKKGEMNLVVMMAESGMRVNTLTVPLPESVMAHIDDDFDRNFDLNVRTLKGQTYLIWSYSHKRVGGAFDGPDENRVLVDVSGGIKVDFNRSEQRLIATPTELSDSIKDGFEIPEIIKDSWENRSFVTEPVAIGDNYHLIERKNGQAFIHRLNKGDGSSNGQIKLDQPLSHLYRLSADKDFVLSLKRLTNSPFYRYDWIITSLMDGTKLGSIKSPYASGDHYVKSNSLYYVEGPWKRRLPNRTMQSQAKSLIAYDFSEKKQIWQIALRDTRYYGVTPP